MLNLIYPARKHAVKVFEKLIEFNPTLYNKKINLPIIYLKGSSIECRDDTDRELQFHQESNFMYLTGAHDVKDASVLISVSDVGTEVESIDEKDVSTVLFIPAVDPLEVMWCGLPETPKQIKERLPALSEVKYQGEFEDYLRSITTTTTTTTTTTSTRKVLTLPTIVNHPHATPDLALRDAIHEARTVKTLEEIRLIAHANHVSSLAHTAVMHHVHNRNISSEACAENLFRSECHRLGCKTQAYEPIFGYGIHAGTLHYTKNDYKFEPDLKAGVLLMDAGCEYLGYASDITRTIPIGNSGKFSKEARDIYHIVLQMQQTAFDHIKPGIEWEEIQILMHKVAAAGLLKLGILNGDITVDEYYQEGHIIPFFPHGVGHFLGLDTHDVRGLPNGKGKHATLKYLRLQRKLQVGNVVTVEPGLYFNQFLLDPVKGSKFINHTILFNYLKVGGIRIEDNVVVTENGCNNLTQVVKNIDDIERITSY